MGRKSGRAVGQGGMSASRLERDACDHCAPNASKSFDTLCELHASEHYLSNLLQRSNAWRQPYIPLLPFFQKFRSKARTPLFVVARGVHRPRAPCRSNSGVGTIVAASKHRPFPVCMKNGTNKNEPATSPKNRATRGPRDQQRNQQKDMQTGKAASH